MNRVILIVLVALSVAAASAYSVFEENDHASVEKCWRGCIG